MAVPGEAAAPLTGEHRAERRTLIGRIAALAAAEEGGA